MKNIVLFSFRPPGPSFLPDLSGTTGLYSSGLEVPFDDDGLSVTSTENGDISSSYRPENLPYGKDMLVNMNLNGRYIVSLLKCSTRRISLKKREILGF